MCKNFSTIWYSIEKVRIAQPVLSLDRGSSIVSLPFLLIAISSVMVLSIPPYLSIKAFLYLAFLWWKKRGWCSSFRPSGVKTLLASVEYPKSYPGKQNLPIRSSGVPLLSVLVASSDLFLKVELVIPVPTKGIQQLGAFPLLVSIYALRSSYWAA